MSGKGERTVLSDLGWSSAQINRSQGIALKEGRLSVPAEKVHTPQMTEAIVFLPFEISAQRHGHFFSISVLNSGSCATWGSHSYRMTCFSFSVVEGTVTSGTQ